NAVGIVSAKLSQRAALLVSGAIPENVNYAVKSSFLLGFLESIPELAPKLKEPNTADVKFADVVEQAKQASALVISVMTWAAPSVTAQPVPRRADDDRLVNVQLGTWKLNLRKSRLPSGAIRSMTTTFAKTTSGDLSVTTDVVEGNGRRIHYEWR